MIIGLPNKDQLFTSQAGENLYFSTCPKRLNSFIVRHETPDLANQLMIDLLDYLYNGHSFSILEKANFDINVYNQHPNGTEFFHIDCPHLLPGIKTFGSSKEQATERLDKLISEYLCKGTFMKHKISGLHSEAGYQSQCEAVLPAMRTFSESLEKSYNGMAKTITNHLILEELKKQAESPIIVTGSFHSGTSALALLLIKNGISMGTNLNYAFDEEDITYGTIETGPFKGIGDLIRRYYPEKQNCISENEKLLLKDYFFRLVKSKIVFPYWGWKSPLAIYLMPLLAQIFPEAKFLHIVRDGRDVALSPHPTFPNNELNKLLYFDQPDISEWEGVKLTPDLGKNVASNFFDKPPNLVECKFLAHLWEKMSILGAKYGADLGKNYLQVRFEKLCLSPKETVTEISEFLSLPLKHDSMEWRVDRVGKYQKPPEWASDYGFMESLEKHNKKGLDFFHYPTDGF